MKQTIIRILKFVGIADLTMTTIFVTAMAIRARGAYIYYYEPNQVIFAAEVVLGLLGFVVGLVELVKMLR